MLGDPSIVRRLRERFVPMALDNVDNPNLAPSEREFLRGKGLEFSTQGMSVFAAGGQLLAMGGGYEADHVAAMLDEAWAKFRSLDPKAAGAPVPPLDPEEAASRRTPPEGGLVLHVTWKVVEDYGETQSSSTTGNGRYDRRFRDALEVDRLWVRQDEARALAAGGDLPPSLARRMARCHLSYVMDGSVERIDARITGDRIEGRFTAERPSPESEGNDPGIGRLAGRITTADGRVTELRLLALGQGTRTTDCGFSAGLTVVPQGRRVAVAVLFSLAEPDDELARVLPHRSRESGYLE